LTQESPRKSTAYSLTTGKGMVAAGAPIADAATSEL